MHGDLCSSFRYAFCRVHIRWFNFRNSHTGTVMNGSKVDSLAGINSIIGYDKSFNGNGYGKWFNGE